MVMSLIETVPLTEEEIERARKLVLLGTPFPWSAKDEIVRSTEWRVCNAHTLPDARLIADMAINYVRLLDEVERLRANEVYYHIRCMSKMMTMDQLRSRRENRPVLELVFDAEHVTQPVLRGKLVR